MTNSAALLCDDAVMTQLVAASAEDPENGVAAIETALATWPADYRLHFLRGSLLIGLKRFIGAHQAMSTAVALAPDFAIARFQLGFFELTSGEAAAASATWAPLKSSLPANHWMALFVEGLEHLIADRFCLLYTSDAADE